MKALGVSRVDYFSLDVEGGELSVLQGIDYKKLDIRSFSIEFNGFADIGDRIKAILQANGYTLAKQDIVDLYFSKGK